MIVSIVVVSVSVAVNNNFQIWIDVTVRWVNAMMIVMMVMNRFLLSLIRILQNDNFRALIVIV